MSNLITAVSVPGWISVDECDCEPSSKQVYNIIILKVTVATVTASLKASPLGCASLLTAARQHDRELPYVCLLFGTALADTSCAAR